MGVVRFFFCLTVVTITRKKPPVTSAHVCGKEEENNLLTLK